MKKIKNLLHKSFSLIMSMFMMFSCVNMTGIQSVFAWDGNVPHEFTKIKNINYPYWWSSKIGGKQWSTEMCTYNGQYSYCLEASKKTPASGNYTASVIENNSNVRKLLYYGFGGPGFNDYVKDVLVNQIKACMPNDMKDYKDYGGTYSNGSNLTWEEAAYLWTHIWLSYAYSGDLMGLDLDALNKKWPNGEGETGFGDNMIAGYKAIVALPDPSNGVGFSTGDTATFKATFDKTNMVQVTNSVTFNAASNETVQIPLQSNVTIHIDGTSAQQTGGTATVWGGQTFHLTAPLENSPTDYTSGALTSSAKGKFCALAISSGNSAAQTHGSWAQESANNLKYSADWMDFGWIAINKKSDNEDMTNGNNCYSLEGAKYEIYSDGVKVDTVTTDKNGYAKSTILPVGNYTVKETVSSKGYNVDENTYPVTVTKDQTVTVTSIEEAKDDPLAIQIVKKDAENGNVAQGDASLAGAEFTVKYYNDVYTKQSDLPKDATRTWVLKTVKRPNGKYLASLTLDECIVKDKSDPLYKKDGLATLPIGTITVQETKAPEGYLLEGATLSDKDGNTTKVDNGIFMTKVEELKTKATVVAGNYPEVSELVKEAKVQIYKEGVYEDGHNQSSGQVTGLNGAEFTIKLKSEVDNVGWDNARTYDVVTTKSNSNDEKGYATTKYLPYGTYILRETKTPSGYVTSPDILFSVKKDQLHTEGVDDLHIVINNDRVYSYVKLVKKDKETGKTVSLNNTSFKIKNKATGKYVEQKVGSTKYSVFTTNSKHNIVVDGAYLSKDDALGNVVTPLMLEHGEYEIEEFITPSGFLALENPVQFTIGEYIDLTKDIDGDPVVTVEIKNEQPKAEIKLDKTVTDLDTDTDLVDRSDLSKIHYVLKASKDIYSPIDGELMFAKDSVITTENSGAKVVAGSEIGDGVYALSKDGHLDITNLPMGTDKTSYYLQEVQTLDGCVLDDTKQEATFEQKDFTTKLYTETIKMNNETTHFEFNKTDVTGDKEVPGATLTIKDEKGNVVDEWVSTDKAHSIEGLVVGKTYTLTETITAKDYVKATDIKFTVKNSSELETVTMKDKQVSFTKTDVTGEKEVEGATITVTDKETGKVVDEWTSTKDSHFINGLEEGRTYILTEKVTPEEYVKATDIEFTVSKEKVNEKVNMKDKQVKISKVEVGGEEINGALMQIIDENGDVVDEWYSEGKPHYANNLEEGKTYTLHEDLSPLGYNLTNDMTLEVTTEKVNQKFDMVDTTTEVDKTDVDGKAVKGATLTIVSSKTKNIVDQWVTGQHIFDIDKDMKALLEKDGKAEGTYFDDEDSMVTFSIAKNKDREDYTLITVKDGVTTYSNIDIKGNETTHKSQNLIVGEEYILRETKAPDTYVQAKEMKFTANDKENQLIVMKDKQVSFTKTDVTGEKEVEGATIVVTDKETGKEVDSWVSGKEPHLINGLQEGKTYVLTEKVTPDEYVKATDVEFTVTEEKVNQKVNMVDKQLTVSKKDMGGDEVEGAKLQIIDENGDVVDEWISTDKPHYTSGLEESKTYTLHEDLSPLGYNVANDFAFTVTTDKETQKVDMTDNVVDVTKVDTKGNLLKGAKLQVVSTKTKNIVDQWTTGEHIFDVTDQIRKEMNDGVAKGKYTDEDKATVQYKITKNGKDEKDGYTLMLTKDDEVSYYIIDKDGNETVHMVRGLEEGNEYKLVELSAPKEYVVSKSQTFVAENKDVTVTMTDKQVVVKKTDLVDGKDVEGAKLTVTDKETGETVDEWTTGKEDHYVSGLEEGKTYTLTEVVAPDGYYTAESIDFTVTTDKEIQKVEMKDAPVLTKIQVNKVDSKTKKAIVSKDFEFTMYSDAECKNEITKVNANQENGTATFENVRFGTYYIKETKAPVGYLLSDEVKKVVVDKNLEGVGNVYSFVYENTLNPVEVKTGDNTNIAGLVGLGLISGCAIVVFVVRRRKEISSASNTEE